MSKLSRSALALCAALASRDARAAQYDVYLAAGQSNMDGRGVASALTGGLSSYAGTQSDVRLWYDNPAAASSYSPSWVSLGTGYSVPGTNLPVPGTDFGPEISFGRAMQDAAAPGHTVAIVKVAKGGTSLSTDWKPGATTGAQLFSLLIDDARAAIASLGGPGDTVTLRGMIWHQGESDTSGASDADSVRASYEARLVNFIDSVRSSLSAPTLPFVVGQIELDHHGLAVPTAQANAASLPGYHTALAGSAGLTLGDGSTHFDAEGQVALGQRFAAAMQTIVPEPAGPSLAAIAAAIAGRRRRIKRPARAPAPANTGG